MSRFFGSLLSEWEDEKFTCTDLILQEAEFHPNWFFHFLLPHQWMAREMNEWNQLKGCTTNVCSDEKKRRSSCNRRSSQLPLHLLHCLFLLLSFLSGIFVCLIFLSVYVLMTPVFSSFETQVLSIELKSVIHVSNPLLASLLVFFSPKRMGKRCSLKKRVSFALEKRREKRRETRIR